MGLTLLDAGVLIGFMDAIDVHHAQSKQAISDAVDRHDQIAVPASAYAEALVVPVRLGDRALAAAHRVVEELPLQVIPINAAIAEVAAHLRQRHGATLRLPDALVIATAVHLDADALVTTDRRWPRRSALGLRGDLVVLAARD